MGCAGRRVTEEGALFRLDTLAFFASPLRTSFPGIQMFLGVFRCVRFARSECREPPRERGETPLRTGACDVWRGTRRWYQSEPMSSRLPAARRKEQLLEVALPVFADRGFHLTSMNDVADAAGVTKPVLYQHFSSKRSLYLELLRTVGDRLMRRIQAATSRAGHPRQQVEEGLRAYFRFVVEDAAAYRLMFGGGTRRDSEFAEEASRVEHAIAEAIAPLIRIEGLGPEERLLFAHGIVGLAEGTSRHWIRDVPDLDPETIARSVADLAWRGLRGAGADATPD